MTAAASGNGVPNVVRDSLVRDGAYDFGLGVVLRAPTDPNGRGASASYRIEYRREPVVPGQPLAQRSAKYARDLDRAHGKAVGTFEEMKRRAAGTYVEYAGQASFGDVVEHWFQSPHPRWSERYPTKVAGLLRNWIVADRVTIERAPGQPPEPIAGVPIGALTGDHYNQALEHVRVARAYRTYTDVHALLVQILKWAAANRYLRPHEATVVAHLPLAINDDEDDEPFSGTAPVPEDEIPPSELIVALSRTAQELFGRRAAIMIDLLAYAGPRISECLALRNDDRLVFDEANGCWRIHIRRQVHKYKRKVMPPKWRRKRWAFVPHFLTDDIAWLLNDTPPGGLLFPSPGRPVKDATGRVVRIDSGLFAYDNWRERFWTRLAEATPGWDERDDWWPPDAGEPPEGMQSERRWRWSVHSLRHVAATYQLNILHLDPDDVAKFLGHRSGVQVWEMYVRVRPNLFGRAAAASHATADPRTGLDGDTLSARQPALTSSEAARR